MMRNLLIAATMGATVLTAVPANAQRNEREAAREYRQDVREARRDYRQAQRQDWREYRRYDYNRVDPRAGNYYADRYYRDGRYYQPRRLSYNDRIYRGNDGRYYCRRNDGTTGLILGAAVGGLLGNSVDRGRSSLLGTLLGAGIGGAVGSSIDRNNISCR
jgi:Glycine zipper 2TM domain